MGNKKKLKSYIREDRPLKLKLYLKSHDIFPGDVKLGHRRNLLHYCAEYGSAVMLRCLLELDCSPSLQDKDGNLPLHIALQRGLREDFSAARETLLEIVMPLLDAYPLGQDVDNRAGVTGHDLLTSLKKKIKSASLSEAQRERQSQKVKEDEDDLWRKKLSEEATFEFEEQLPRYNYEDDYSQERTRESFSDWSERVGQEYLAKQRRQNHHTFWRDKKRKSDSSRDGATSSKKARNEDTEEEKLHKAREEMRKNFKPSPTKNRPDRLLMKKQQYEKKFTQLLNHLPGRTLTFACIPWPSLDLDSVADVLFCDFPDKNGEAYRKYLRSQQVRWHPDKFTQKFGDHLHPDHLSKVMLRVKAISQILNQLNRKK